MEAKKIKVFAYHNYAVREAVKTEKQVNLETEEDDIISFLIDNNEIDYCDDSVNDPEITKAREWSLIDYKGRKYYVYIENMYCMNESETCIAYTGKDYQKWNDLSQF